MVINVLTVTNLPTITPSENGVPYSIQHFRCNVTQRVQFTQTLSSMNLLESISA